ncbi:hypothetical protein FOE78_04975 [Microlunatus elymi]|uniref:DUF8175 domain-containing protein n=1 Tax=Microlunatus elymi TaxID=2596828 RepID=A0A516PW17_9ACTN|nr:hypothetical protein [Microlunatus elymi]QDP95350.1 hypothetical protein FOE78_04975 [Microlunatus elymi]
MSRNRRRAGVVIGGLVILLAAIAVVAYLAGRSGEPQATPTTSSTAAVTPSDTPTVAPSTASSSDAADGLDRGVVAAGRGGKSEGPDGLPLTYDRTQDGAAAAATNYLIWMNSIKITDKSAADAMATATAADDTTRTALVRSFDEIRSGMRGLTTDELQPARGAYAVARYSPDSATVYVWAPEVTADASGASQQTWGIDAVNVVWARGDWKLNHELIVRSGGAAADPKDPSGNPTSAEKRSILSRTPEDPGEIQDSAEQSWLEYANAPH